MNKDTSKIDFSRVSEKAFVDMPSSRPALPVELQRVGMRQRPIKLTLLNPLTNVVEQFWGNITVSCSLPGDKRGIHMSRIEEAIDELRSSGCAPRVFVTELCNLVATTQNLQAAFVEFSSQFEQRVSKNVSGKSSIELLTLYASSSKTGSHNESKVGLTVPFINACPCTQRWAMRDFYGVLKKRGFEESDAAELTLAAPFQAHTNRGAATVTIQDNTVEYRDLYGVLDRSVPIIRELLKGADEHALVSRAQRDGQFCEDNIRSVLVELVRTFGTSLLDSVSVDVSVEVDESVHFHNLWANVSDSYGAIRSLVAGAAADF